MSSSTDSWVALNLTGPGLPIDISLERRFPLKYVEVEGAYELRYDFRPEATQLGWNVWLSSVRRRSRGEPRPLMVEVLSKHPNRAWRYFLAHDCIQQFELYLRLAKSDPFWIGPWEHRRYLMSQYSPVKEYELDSDVRELMPVFNETLRDYLWCKELLPLLQPPIEMLRKKTVRDSRDELENLLGEKKSISAATHYLSTALAYYSKALAEESDSGWGQAVVVAAKIDDGREIRA